jgi:hypothetical protein
LPCSKKPVTDPFPESDESNPYQSTLTHLLTHSLTKLNPFREAANCAASKELPSILRNPKVHYRVHKSPLLVPVLSHINQIHTIPSYFSKIHPNNVHPPTSRSSQWSLSFWRSHQYPIYIYIYIYIYSSSPLFVLHVLSISSTINSVF